MKFKLLWDKQAHKEKIKSIHYSEYNKSNDHRIRLFSAVNGDYFDELKQGANKHDSVPIGIIYKGVDPISSNIF
jgi:hypothetical protein